MYPYRLFKVHAYKKRLVSFIGVKGIFNERVKIFSFHVVIHLRSTELAKCLIRGHHSALFSMQQINLLELEKKLLI